MSNNAFDISKMKEEAKELSDFNVGLTGNSKIDKIVLEKLTKDVLSGMTDIAKETRRMFRRGSKVDKHGKIRYGTLIVCEECGAKNTTLFNVNGRKLCKKCKGENNNV